MESMEDKTMKLADILETIQGLSGWQWTGIVVLILTIIQISPIKIDPWKKIARFVGKALNQEMLEKQEEFVKESKDYRKKNDDRIDNLSNKMDERAAEDARNRILRFGDEIKSKQIRHSEEYYNQILDDITSYDKYCHEHPDFKNERTIATEKIIRQEYEDHMLHNDFL